MPPLKFDGILAHPLLHAQAGVAGTHGMVFMGDRRAEQRHHAISITLLTMPS